MIINEQPTGIIKTMPISWIKALPSGLKCWERNFMRMNDYDKGYWVFNLSGKPKFNVTYFYLLFDNAIRYRTNIIGYEDEQTIKCYSGEIRHGKVWVEVSAPVIKLLTPIHMKGFQGFRYAYEVYS